MITKSLRTERGYFGIGVYHAKKSVNIGTLMRSAYCFGADFVFTIGRRYQRQASDTPNATAHVPCYHYGTIDELIGHLPFGAKLIGIELAPGAMRLGDYVHPHRAVYLLGAEDHGIPEKDLTRCHSVLEIPGALRCLNVATAGSIVMYDRKIRGGTV